MIVKAIPKDGGLFIPGLTSPESKDAEAVLVEVQILPHPPKQPAVAQRIKAWQRRLEGRDFGDVVADLRADRQR